MRSANGGLCTDTFVYVDEQCTFDMDIIETEVQVTIAGKYGGYCFLVLSKGAVRRLAPLLDRAVGGQSG
ncbi:hypothetical protein [Amycolatopsis cihanbeyliensis]|uniref:Uncharacterized protein n=1 Tax=Amycolatopsis cihanbeyliensis TaxID=1128664 RepID=A0A542DQ34_AMYCI|nr:hypothetical protein [Amycolatopsis cihanbeyliensis]TQJ05177.1 hypothetical protein FB471_5003 [Amycolatopsis cihanbeyliensis]